MRRIVLQPDSLTADVAAGLLLTAGYVHGALIADHWRDWWGYGAFFLGAAVLQAALGLALLIRRPAWLLLTGMAVNSGIVGLYVVTRTVGPPVGPHVGHLEPVGVVDMACLAAELATIGCLLTLLGARERRLAGTALAAAGGLLWIARAGGLTG